MTAVFRETVNLPAERRVSLLTRLRAVVDVKDAAALLCFVGLFAGLAMVWLPLAFIVCSSLGLAFIVYISLPRAP